MRDVLLNYGIFITWLIAACDLALTVMLFTDWNNKRDPLILVMGTLGAGLAFDAVVVGFGGMLILPFLSLLSQLRYILHGLLLPLNIMVLAYSWTFYRKGRILSWCITVPLMLLGAVAGIFRELDAVTLSEIIRFVSISPKESWMERVNVLLTYGMMLPIFLTGIRTLVHDKSPSILLGGILMFVFSVLGPATGNADLIFLISMVGELCLLLFYVIYERRHITV